MAAQVSLDSSPSSSLYLPAYSAGTTSPVTAMAVRTLRSNPPSPQKSPTRLSSSPPREVAEQLEQRAKALHEEQREIDEARTALEKQVESLAPALRESFEQTKLTLEVESLSRSTARKHLEDIPVDIRATKRTLEKYRKDYNLAIEQIDKAIEGISQTLGVPKDSIVLPDSNNLVQSKKRTEKEIARLELSLKLIEAKEVLLQKALQA